MREPTLKEYQGELTPEVIEDASPRRFKEQCSRNGGRPTKCTKRRAKKITECLAKGMTLCAACAAAGTNHRTVRQWIRKGRGEIPCDDPRPYRQFCKWMEVSQAQLQEECLETIIDVMKGGHVSARTITTRPDGSEIVNEKITTPKAEPAQWLLERKFAKNFGNKQKVEHSGTVQHQNVNVNLVANLSDAEAMALVNLLEKSRQGLPAPA